MAFSTTSSPGDVDGEREAAATFEPDERWSACGVPNGE